VPSPELLGEPSAAAESGLHVRPLG
jgi:hypothetical protein